MFGFDGFSTKRLAVKTGSTMLATERRYASLDRLRADRRKVMKSITIDYSKRLAEEPGKGHNRWHEAIAPVIEAAGRRDRDPDA